MSEITTEEAFKEKARQDHNRYMREKNRGSRQFRFKPDVVKRIMAMHDEYVQECHKTWNVPATLNEFVHHFCELGYLEWRKKQRGNKDILS